ncbi:MAG: hypothetical protein ACYC35_03115 [Pirellulales bacterium]
MTEQVLDSESVAPATKDAAQGGKSRLSGKIKVAGCIVGFVLVECVLAYLFLPSAAGTTAEAPTDQESSAQPAAKETEPPVEGKEGEGERARAAEIEIDLGEFKITSFQPASNTTLCIDFRLYGTVAQANREEFARRMEENKHRFRDQVLVTVRSAAPTDLTDAGLGLIKRKILEKTNAAFGRPLLRSVVFSDFSFIEQ